MTMGYKTNSQKCAKGQTAIEYLLLVATALLVLIAFLIPGGPFHRQLNKTMTQEVDQIDMMVNDFKVIP